MRDLTRRAVLLAPAALAAASTEPVRLPKKIRVGILGLEGHTGLVTRPLTRLPDVEVVAYWSSGRAALRAVPAAKRYDDWKAMLDSEKLDVLAVTNNNGERAEPIIEAAKRKIHVIAEKPLAIDRRRLQAVRAAVEQSGISLGMMLDKRYEPRFLALKKIVSEGTIGEVIQVSSQISYQMGARAPWFQKTATYGGSITWVGIHMLDLMRWTSGREFTAVAGFETRKGRTMGEMETATASVLQLDNGGVATLRVDYLRPESAKTHEDYRVRLAGDKGIAEYTLATGVTLITRDSPAHTITELPEEQSLFIDYLNATYNGKA
ncbi:MAG TPA: Gfo/Idh/MocA family oxidoreductase, partial [Bryobacteraceae bacterium]|nr:Gfo/Idh/MocA family oxidoreductase [Bryobacteraceae bacterium]